MWLELPLLDELWQSFEKEVGVVSDAKRGCQVAHLDVLMDRSVSQCVEKEGSRGPAALGTIRKK